MTLPIIHRPFDRRTVLKGAAAAGVLQVASPFIIAARGETPIRIGMVDPFGTLVNFGNASGAPPPLDIRLLGNRGSQMVTRMGMGFFFRDRRVQHEAAAEIFDLMTKGILTARIERTYPLREAAQAHRDLEARRTMGSVVLLP